MALKDMKSLYDRHKRGELGESIARPDGGGPNPSNGDFFTEGGNTASPFDSSDQLVDLLTKNVTSNNHPYIPGGQGSITYQASPKNTTDFADMNGNDFGAGFVNPLTGNYDGRYTNPDNGATF